MTKKRRLIIYRKLRKYLKEEEKYYSFGYCFALRDLFGLDGYSEVFRNLSELLRKKPKRTYGINYWWSVGRRGTQKRIKVLDEIISEMTIKK